MHTLSKQRGKVGLLTTDGKHLISQHIISICNAGWNSSWTALPAGFKVHKTKICRVLPSPAANPSIWWWDGGLQQSIYSLAVPACSPGMFRDSKESYDQPRQHIKMQRYYFVNKGPSSQGYGFSSGHVWMWELDYKESWAPKNWCFWTVLLEKILESPLDYKKIQPVHPKGDQSWVFIGRTDVEAETPVLWPPDVKSWLIWKDPDAGKDWRREEKGTTEDEMIGWYHRLNGHGCGWTPGAGDGQGGLACCGSWGRKESDMTEILNRTELN